MSADQQFLLALVAGLPPSAAALAALGASLVGIRRIRHSRQDLLARLDDLNARTLQLERVVAELEAGVRVIRALIGC